MPDFKNEWLVSKATTKIPISSAHQLEISVSCAQDVQLFGVRGSEKIPLKIGREWRFKTKVKGFDRFELKGKTATDYGYRVVSRPIQDGEPLNSDNPPAVPLDTGDNLLLQVKRLMRDEFNRNRSPVLEPEELPWATRYEVEEDDYDFEEELLASKQKSSPNQNPDPDAEATQPPPAAAEPPPQSEDATSPAHAAE